MYVLAVTVTFTALSAVFVALRLFTRFVLVKSPGLDDLLISIALVRDTKGASEIREDSQL